MLMLKRDRSAAGEPLAPPSYSGREDQECEERRIAEAVARETVGSQVAIRLAAGFPGSVMTALDVLAFSGQKALGEARRAAVWRWLNV